MIEDTKTGHNDRPVDEVTIVDCGEISLAEPFNYMM